MAQLGMRYTPTLGRHIQQRERKRSVLNEDTNAVRRELGDGLILRTLGTEAELDGPCAVNSIVHGPGVGSLLRHLALRHPDVEPRDVIWVEDQGKAVATVCGIPWHLHLSEAKLEVLELGLVATIESWRGRGLQRAMVGYFRERAQERGAHLSIIQGIPGFYRQFGYTYVLPLEGGFVLEHRQIPATEPRLSVRETTPEDLPALASLYENLSTELDLHTVRAKAVWSYLVRHAAGTETEGEFWVCERAGAAAGYMFLPKHHFGDELVISEAAAEGVDAAMAMLSHAAALSRDRGSPGIRLSLHDGSALSQVARSLGARDTGRYAWQVWCPDLRRLLDALRPALSARLRASAWADHTGDLVLSAYRYGLRLEVADGAVRSVAREPSPQAADLRAHEDQLLPLLLGHRTAGELAGWHPDFIVRRGAQTLLEALFPKLRAFLYPVY